ncbi:hypothetical protein KAR91_83900 [Candidatus Pacearchaeota archaeon]|nr:hypothetical protein [Candidatus Pacearchaeota archaeon]
MAEYLEYDCGMEGIPEQDSPEPGMVYISKGNRQGTWKVATWKGRTLGIIVDIENARKFAEVL